MEIKSEINYFDFSKICRMCLAEKDVMQTLFVRNESIDQSVAERIMCFTNVRLEDGDGLPSLICLDCVHQVNTAFSFKQLCEQSDMDLRRYLERPTIIKDTIKQEKRVEATNYGIVNGLVGNFGLDDPWNKHDEYEDDEDYSLFMVPVEAADTMKKEEGIEVKDNIKQEEADYEIVGGFSLEKDIQATNYKIEVENFALDSSLDNSNEDDKDFSVLRVPVDPSDEKAVAQRQLSKTIKNSKLGKIMSKLNKKSKREKKKTFECEVCKKRFIYQTLLTRHMVKHSEEKPFVCKICNKVFYRQNTLSMHMRIHEKKQGDSKLLQHICDYCRSELPDAVSLDLHMRQHTGDKPFLCNTCGKNFPQRNDLELHLRKHTGERPFPCEICQKKYVSKSSLKTHMKTHSNERPYACEFCGKAFKQHNGLRNHRLMHNTEKPECNICQKKFTTVTSLKYHMRNHTGEQPYVCNVCGRGFTVNRILLRHMRIHSGEKPYVCAICERAFTQSSTLKTHMKFIHNLQKVATKNCNATTKMSNTYIVEEQKYNPHETQDQDNQIRQFQQSYLQYLI